MIQLEQGEDEYIRFEVLNDDKLVVSVLRWGRLVIDVELDIHDAETFAHNIQEMSEYLKEKDNEKN